MRLKFTSKVHVTHKHTAFYLRQVSSKNAMRDTRQARKYILVRLGMLQKCFQKILAKKV